MNLKRVNNEKSIVKMGYSCHKGRVHSKKKKYCEFSQLEGGVRTKFCHFHNFLFFSIHALNHPNLQRNFFNRGGTPLDH